MATLVLPLLKYQRFHTLWEEHYEDDISLASGGPLSDDRTASHLFHNLVCINPRHIVYETLKANKGRNGCPAGDTCQHRVTCLNPGPYFKPRASWRTLMVMTDSRCTYNYFEREKLTGSIQIDVSLCCTTTRCDTVPDQIEGKAR
ncbi:hypothetical protein ACTFIZ_008772 [Dictyostelium cf. discoideum]